MFLFSFFRGKTIDDFMEELIRNNKGRDDYEVWLLQTEGGIIQGPIGQYHYPHLDNRIKIINYQELEIMLRLLAEKRHEDYKANINHKED